MGAVVLLIRALNTTQALKVEVLRVLEILAYDIHGISRALGFSSPLLCWRLCLRYVGMAPDLLTHTQYIDEDTEIFSSPSQLWEFDQVYSSFLL